MNIQNLYPAPLNISHLALFDKHKKQSMKNSTFLFIFLFLSFSCTKEKINQKETQSFYESHGNMMLLQVGEELEGIYEYQMESTTFMQDSFHLIHVLMNDGNEEYRGWKLASNQPLLYEQNAYHINFYAPKIAVDQLEKSSEHLPLDTTKIQWFPKPNGIESHDIWSKISNLAIVKAYRAQSPTTKIGIERMVFYTYNPDFGFSVPSEKYLVFFVK